MVDHSGNIVGDEVWADLDRIVGNITIPSATSLTIDGGFTIFWAAGGFKITIASGGFLNLNGTIEYEGGPSFNAAIGIVINSGGAMRGAGTIKDSLRGLDIIGPFPVVELGGLTIDHCTRGINATTTSAHTVVISGGISVRSNITDCKVNVHVRRGLWLQSWSIAENNGLTPHGEYGITSTNESGPQTFINGNLILEDIVMTAAGIYLPDIQATSDTLVSVTNVDIDADQTIRGSSNFWIQLYQRATSGDGSLTVLLDRVVIRNFHQSTIESGGVGLRTKIGHLLAATVTDCSFEAATIAMRILPEAQTGTLSFKGGSTLSIQRTLFPSQTVYLHSGGFARQCLDIGGSGMFVSAQNIIFGSADQRVRAIRASISVIGGQDLNGIKIEGCTFFSPNDAEKVAELVTNFHTIYFNGNNVTIGTAPGSNAVKPFFDFRAIEDGVTKILEVRNNVMKIEPGPVALLNEGMKLRIVDSSLVLLSKKALVQSNVFLIGEEVRMIMESNVELNDNIFHGQSLTAGVGVYEPTGITANFNIFRWLESGIEIIAQSFLGEITCNTFGPRGPSMVGIVNKVGSQQNAIQLNTFAYSDGGIGITNTAGPFQLIAESNYWNSDDGPSGFGPGTGSPVGADVDVVPFLESACEAATVSVGGLSLGAKIVRGIDLDQEANSATRVKLELFDKDNQFVIADFLGRFVDVVWGPSRIIRVYVDKVRKKIKANVAFWTLTGLDSIGVARYTVVPDDAAFNYTVATDIATIFKDLVDELNLQRNTGLVYDSDTIPVAGVDITIDFRGMTIIKAWQELRKQAADDDPWFWVEGDLSIYFRLNDLDEGKAIVDTEIPDGDHTEDIEDTFNRIRFKSNAPSSPTIEDDLFSRAQYGERELPAKDNGVTTDTAALEKTQTLLVQNATSIRRQDLTIKADLGRFRLRDLVVADVPKLEVEGPFVVVKLRHHIRKMIVNPDPVTGLAVFTIRGDTTITLGEVPIKMSSIFKGQ